MPDSSGGDFISKCINGGLLATLLVLWANKRKEKADAKKKGDEKDAEYDLKDREFLSKERNEAYEVLKTRLKESERDAAKAEARADQYKVAARWSSRHRDDLIDLIHRVLMYTRRGLLPTPPIIAEMEKCEVFAPGPDDEKTADAPDDEGSQKQTVPITPTTPPAP